MLLSFFIIMVICFILIRLMPFQSEAQGQAAIVEAARREALGYNKPQKEFFEACYAQIPDFAPEKAIILGDSLTSDILGGINGGIKTCWFNLRGEKGRDDIVPDFEIRTLEEFPPLLERL